jgi:hypothetical protein
MEKYMKNNTIKLDKIGSVLKNFEIPEKVSVSSTLQIKEGNVLIVKALAEQNKYGHLELTDGRLSKIYTGDIIAGVLGQRKALEGIVGIIPQELTAGDTLHILNLGGVIGKAVSWNNDFVNSPIPVKILGSLLVKDKPLNIQNFSMKTHSFLGKIPPIIAVIGTSMGTGKTTVATEIVHMLYKKIGIDVVAGKVTGVATQRDILGMKDAGAQKVLSLLDVGLSSTINHKNLVLAGAKKIINELSKNNPDCIVLEFGDGLIGWYGVEDLLSDPEFAKNISIVVGCASDLTGAYGMVSIFKKKGMSIDFFSGRVTNNTAGIDYLETIMHIPAQDLRNDTGKFLKMLNEKGMINI